MPSPRVAFAIHHVNPWGGHDRSMLEIIRRLSHRRMNVEVHSFRLDDPQKQDRWGPFTFVPVRPFIRKPAIVMLTWFYLVTAWRFSRKLRGARRRATRVHATGACILPSDVIQVQFVQAEWKRIKRTLPPVIYRSHGARSPRFFRRHLSRAYAWIIQEYNLLIERIAYRPSKRYIAISHRIQRELMHHFRIPAERISVVHHGVDAEAFHPSPDERTNARAALGCFPEDVVLLVVGEYERKGLATALQAIALLPDSLRARARLLAVGQGDGQGFQRLADKLGVSKNLTLLPHQKDIARFYRLADVFVLPTLYEPFGLVVLEAMASGLACVVSECAGAAELLEDRESAMILRNPADPRELMQQLEPVLESRAFRESLGKSARAIAQARSWDVVADAYHDILLEGRA